MLNVVGYLALTAAFTFVGFFVILFASLDNPFDDRPFSETTWAAYHQSTDYDSPRGQMYADLKRHHLRRGMSRDEVLALLGEPDLRESATHFSYSLGAWSGFRMDYDTLEVEFSKAGHLTSVDRVQH